MYNFSGPFLPDHSFELNPQLPARISGAPSLFTSAIFIFCHSPVEKGMSVSLKMPF